MGDKEEKALSSLLYLEEQLLWSGQPKQGVLFRSVDILIIPFSLAWCGGALAWEVGVLVSNVPFFLALFGIPVVLIGLYMAFGRFIFDSKIRASTFYGLTSQRILIASSGKSKSLNLATMTNISFIEEPDGSGTIYFGATDPRYVLFADMEYLSIFARSASHFAMIQNVKDVYEKVARAQKEASKES